MNRIFSIARYLFLQSIRDKLFIALILISIIIVSGNFALDFFSQGIQDRLIFDFGSSLASMLGAFLCIYLVTTQVRGEIDNRLSYFIITSETPRSHYLLGKWAGSVIFVIFNLMILFAEILMIIYFNSSNVSYMCLTYFYVLTLKLSILCSIATLFSVTGSIVIAPALSLFIYVMGHWSAYVKFAVQKSGGGPFISVIDFIMTYLMPNFKFFTIEHVTTENFSGMWNYLGMLTVYAIAMNFIVLYASTLFFEKKDI